MIGKQLGHYEIVRKLGAGGMGEVYVASDGKLNREVALKVLPEGLADDADRLERFEREAKTVAALNHPNIVTIYSVEEADGIRFMTMELIRGDTLDALIPEGGMAVKKFLEVADPLADAVAAAHAKGVQHRDLKPANVMVDEDGRVKVLDFGLATQRDVAGPEAVTQMLTTELTGEGKIVGTVSYMSPEQAEGRILDHRSDIFSLGILLYEMVTGQRPFSGDTNLSILSSILKDDPSSVSDVRDSIPIPIARLIQRALAKDPSKRYQSAADLRQDLADMRRDMETGEVLSSGLYSGTHAAPALDRPKPWLRWAGYGVGAATVMGLLAMGLPMLMGPARPAGGAAAPVGMDLRPAVAVFYFDNISNDAELDWLRTGLTDMLVTDLSQTNGVQVLATDRLYSMLQEMGADEAPTTSFDVVQRVTGRAEMNTAIVGSFARAGDEIRINIRIQDPRSGDVLASNSVQGETDEIFDLVDDITDWVETQFEVDASDRRSGIAVGANAGGGANAVTADSLEDRDLNEVTTKDIEAFRLYAEGVKMNLASREEMAIPLLEAAVEKDPEFAMAHAKLSVAYGNEGNAAKAEEFARQAFERSDRLPPRERHYIRGRFLSMNPETVGEAVEEYTRAVELFPDHMAARHNLAGQLVNLERFREAIPHFEELRRLGHRFAPSYQQLANAYAIVGNNAAGVAVLEEYVAGNPDNWQGHAALAEALVRDGDFAAATAALERAYELNGDRQTYESMKWAMAVMTEDWDAARRSSQAVIELGGNDAFVGHMRRADELLYFGQITAARAEVLRARALADENRNWWMWTNNVLVNLHDLEGNHDAALATVTDARNRFYGPQTAQQIEINDAVSRAKLGDTEGAQRSLERFRAEIGQLPIPDRTRRRVDAQVDGLMALAQRDAATAAAALETALDAMPTADMGADGITVKFYLGEALWESGRRDDAASYFREVEAADLPRVQQPAEWVRSLWYLGEYAAGRGDEDAARGYFNRFLGYWGDGEVDRDRVARARAFVAGND